MPGNTISSAPATEDDSKNVELYTKLVEKHGIDFRALDWGSRESQELRFAVLAAVGDLRGASVLDVGCGLADFWLWTDARQMSVRYTGIDITPAMIQHARQRFSAIRLEAVSLADIAAREPKGFDFVVASGIFTYRQMEPEKFLEESITGFLRLARRGVAFNSLSAWAPSKDPGEFYADPLQTLAFCRSLTNRVVLRHDYHQRDFTIYLYPEGAA